MSDDQQVSDEELVAAITEAARAAFTQAREEHPDDTFYCFALFTDGLAAYIHSTCMSEEGLVEVAGEYAARSGTSLEQEAMELRWMPADSPYHLLGEEQFDHVQELLDRRGDLYGMDDEDAVCAESDARFEACFRALSRLDEEGFFGIGTDRAGVIVNVLQGDQSDRSILENARRLNAPAHVELLAA
ncbi:DUF4303 domain-containing protein, partial [Actinomadura adrarensis]